MVYWGTECMYAPSGTEDSELNTDVTEDSKLNTDLNRQPVGRRTVS